MSKVNLAIIQHPPVFLNLAASVQRADELIRDAAHRGAQVIVFPETWLPGYPVWLDHAPGAALWDHAPAKLLYRLLVENAVMVGDRNLCQLMALCRELEVCVIMGAHELLGDTLYNTMFLLGDDGQTMRLRRKLMPTFTEKLIWGRGDGSTLEPLPTPYGLISGLICWEHWMPLARAAVHAKGEVLHVAQWPAVNDLHQLASRQYAFEGQCYVAAAGAVLSRGDVLSGLDSLPGDHGSARQLLESIPGDDDRLLLNGGSAVIAPDTHYLVGPLFDNVDTLYATIDLRPVIEGHLVMDTGGHYSRPDVFTLLVDDQPAKGVVFATDSSGCIP